MKPRVLAVKIKVDMEDLLMDMSYFYKIPDFDPTFPITIQVRDELVVNIKGAQRQDFTEFFSMVFIELKIFGSSLVMMVGRLDPVYSSKRILTGVFGKSYCALNRPRWVKFPVPCTRYILLCCHRGFRQSCSRSSFVDIYSRCRTCRNHFNGEHK